MKKNKNRRLLVIFLSAAVCAVLLINNFNNHNLLQKGGFAEKQESVEASSYPLTDRDWSVKYHVKNKGIYFENVITRFSFQGSDSKLASRDGFIAVFIDGKWKMNVHQSIFIIKQMPQGKHEVSLRLKKKDGTDYGLKKNIYVHVH
ncbi:hypothetical protein [Fictibacillus barbaricus]|uniref:Uncharacterized protein n=1 Tax=Fictibacillus barbaricus TaxID=182136 RepID=A0ABU1TY40_9BACL|nr:hypothetical protein [Fictibacillus barbaricus]MDR7072123.1 hypothetical protein [Fictibacillus barbaricus]